MQFRVAFDSSLPAVAAQAFTASGRSFADGEPFEWRAMGLSEETLQALWMSGYVRFAPVLETFHVAPGELVSVTPPVPDKPKKQIRASSR